MANVIFKPTKKVTFAPLKKVHQLFKKRTNQPKNFLYEQKSYFSYYGWMGAWPE